jgi:membrane associated rhomboid family serine protease
MGGYLVMFPQARILSLVPLGFFSSLMEVPALIVVGIWAVLQFINASFLGGGGMLHGGGVAYVAHVGGFLAGVVIILILGGRRLAEERDSQDFEERRYR